MGSLFIVIGILGIATLMVVHESGHYFAARAFGMRVTKFSIGFGPTFFKVQPIDGHWWFTTAGERVRFKLGKHDPEKHGPTVFQVALIPFLAYVQIAGMNPLEEHDPEDKGSYANASLIGRIVTIFAGPFANYASASIFFLLAFLLGPVPAGLMPPGTPQTFVSVNPGTPAEEAGMVEGDRIVSVDGVEVTEWTAMAEVISKNGGNTIPVVVERKVEENGSQLQQIELSVTPRLEGERGIMGVRSSGPHVGVGEAALLAVKVPAIVVREVVIGLGELIRGKVKPQVQGPVEMVRQTAEEARAGLDRYVFFLGQLSAYLGAFNLIPFPALDGARLLFLGYEATTRRKPNARVEVGIHAFGLVLLLGLLLFVTFGELGGFKK